jgi:hypothetical protein
MYKCNVLIAEQHALCLALACIQQLVSSPLLVACTRGLHGPIFSGPARPSLNPARPVFLSSIVGPARLQSGLQARPGPARFFRGENQARAARPVQTSSTYIYWLLVNSIEHFRLWTKCSKLPKVYATVFNFTLLDLTNIIFRMHFLQVYRVLDINVSSIYLKTYIA